VTLEIPSLPLITARFSGDYSGELSIDGVRESFAADSQEQLREAILSRVSNVAVELGRPVKVITEDDEGAWLLVVHADGEIGGEERLDAEPTVDPDDRLAHPHRAGDQSDLGAGRVFNDPDDSNDSNDSDDVDLVGIVDPDDIEFAPTSALGESMDAYAARVDDEPEPEPEPEPELEPAFEPQPETRPNPALQTETEPEPVPLAGRASFLTEELKPDSAKKGWRGFLAKTGLPIPASAKERIEREETHAVSRHWAGPRTIAIVNGKGGANKTPTTAMLAALFARNGGSGVLAWDNNETRGTLGWRTEQGPHDATVQTLLPNTEHLFSPSAQASDLSHFVHHQTADKYDVLRSNPTMLATQQRITSDDFDRLHSVAAKYFRLIFIDSGNDESAERWLRMIDHTDQLVIATTALGEHAEAGALLLEALAQRDETSARLASQAVVIVSQSEKAGTAADARKVAAGFEPLARRAVSVPFDPAIHGGRLAYSSLTPASRRAWLHAAAAVAEGL
jgi:MinD-like ATPase involved in chromosome partitioning or flagellar assembly